VDKKRNTLVYLAISDKLVEGSPQRIRSRPSDHALGRRALMLPSALTGTAALAPSIVMAGLDPAIQIALAAAFATLASRTSGACGSPMPFR
jgi:hypothetical protein